MMKDVVIALQEWSQALALFHLPRWEELPEFDLYMDQVVSYVEKSTAIFLQNQTKLITPAMVNNYVKLKLIPAPYKKKYNRKHLAYLIAITVLKQILSIKDVRDGILCQAEEEGERQAYDSFCHEIEAALQSVAGSIVPNNTIPLFTAVEYSIRIAVKMAAIAFACKIMAEKTVALQSAKMREGEHK